MAHTRTRAGLRRATAIALLVSLTTVLDASAQVVPVDTLEVASGRVLRAHWPDVLYETQGWAMNRPDVAAAENFAETDVLPFVDTLALGYSARVVDDAPRIDFELSWQMGEGGVLDGRAVPRMPDSVSMNLLDLHARVMVAGEHVGDLIIALDSLWLPPDEFVYTFSSNADWASLFRDMDEEATRSAFRTGFTLEHLEILRAGFEAAAPSEVREETDVVVAPRPPRRRSIWVNDPGIWIGSNIGPDPYRRPPRRPAAQRPRGDTIARDSGEGESRRTRGGRDRSDADGSPERDASTNERQGASASDGAGRSGRSGFPVGGLRGDDDDNDDDDRDFLGPALGAAAAVGALAYFGGTVGYFGYPEDAPIGLEAGRVTRRGGALLHAAVNSDVLSGGGQERMVVGISGAFRPVLGGVHPMAGIDVWFHERGDTYDARPTVTLGLLVRAGPAAIHFGTDTAGWRPRMGLAFSFRGAARPAR